MEATVPRGRGWTREERLVLKNENVIYTRILVTVIIQIPLQYDGTLLSFHWHAKIYPWLAHMGLIMFQRTHSRKGELTQGAKACGHLVQVWLRTKNRLTCTYKISSFQVCAWHLSIFDMKLGQGGGRKAHVGWTGTKSFHDDEQAEHHDISGISVIHSFNQHCQLRPRCSLSSW